MSYSLPLPVGTRVEVRDGTPRPPERFKRKLEAWKNHNYEGFVVGQCHYTGGYIIEAEPVRSYIRILRTGVRADRVAIHPQPMLVQVSDEDGRGNGTVVLGDDKQPIPVIAAAAA